LASPVAVRIAPVHSGVTASDLAPTLAVAPKLAAPFDLRTMLREVVEAAKQVLQAERGTVWLYDGSTDELLLEIATDVDPIRVPAGKGSDAAGPPTRSSYTCPA